MNFKASLVLILTVALLPIACGRKKKIEYRDSAETMESLESSNQKVAELENTLDGAEARAIAAEAKLAAVKPQLEELEEMKASHETRTRLRTEFFDLIEIGELFENKDSRCRSVQQLPITKVLSYIDSATTQDTNIDIKSFLKGKIDQEIPESIDALSQTKSLNSHEIAKALGIMCKTSESHSIIYRGLFWGWSFSPYRDAAACNYAEYLVNKKFTGTHHSYFRPIVTNGTKEKVNAWFNKYFKNKDAINDRAKRNIKLYGHCLEQG